MRSLLHFSCEGIALTVWEFWKEPGEAEGDLGGEEALVGQFAWTVWVGDVTTRKLPVLGSRARMGDVIRLASPGQDT
jgi:hypothetical protein